MRKQLTPEEALKLQFKMLSKCVRNLLIDNKNFKGDWDRRGYYFEHETFHSYVNGPLKESAEFIIEQIDALSEMVSDYVKSYEEDLKKPRCDCGHTENLSMGYRGGREKWFCAGCIPF